MGRGLFEGLLQYSIVCTSVNSLCNVTSTELRQTRDLVIQLRGGL